jgi:phosphatidate cytidylyltransferase
MNNKPAGAFSDPNLVKRVISALVLAPLFIYVVYIGGWAFKALFIAIGFIIIWEWHGMIKGKWSAAYLCEALPYALIAALAPIILRSHEQGLIILIWLCLVVWGTDVGAYFCGRIIGGVKLAPRFSPNKTWSGAIGGAIIGAGLGALIQEFSAIEEGFTLFMVISSLLTSVASQIGDLYESALKRRLGVKDSSQLIPGHGGVMDRLDGFIFAAPIGLLFW